MWKNLIFFPHFVTINNLLVFSQVANETLHTDRPDLPQCFQLSVLAWLPCIYLWAACPIYLFYLKRNNRGYIMMSLMNRFKTVSKLRGSFFFWFFERLLWRNKVSPAACTICSKMNEIHKKDGIFVSGVWLVVMDRVLDGPLLHVPRAAAGSHPATNLLCHPAGSWHDHGEDTMTTHYSFQYDQFWKLYFLCLIYTQKL